MSEKTLLAYFIELSKSNKPSTMWATYSMLKTTINIKNNININKYENLTSFLKTQSKGFQSKKANTLTPEQIKKFLDEAPDQTHLATKLATIFGICGACRRDELANINMEHIKDRGSLLLVTIPTTKNYKPRSFVVTEEFYSIYKKYLVFRPHDIKTPKLFLNYQKGKCTHQVIGLNKFGKMPTVIATYLNLPDPNSYTGHTFRRTSATILADSGADILTLKRHGGWKSNAVAEGYVDNSFTNKKNISNQITTTITNNNFPTFQSAKTIYDQAQPSTSTNCIQNDKENEPTNTQTDTIDQQNINKNLTEILSASKLKSITFSITNYANLTITLPPKEN
ncbi:uncharacterized protein LOC114940557 [Nylanderia fulva]|uniref:uncharacterized protein LOC114940557 n=1 Tax=Nylanderia fulva TaxID=613905 RepID=UPI0010FB482B|nr:uncharacterized protein LOC114940557 [Nylanderia fulva]